ncbi:hypothetical protein [Methanoculleus sp.]|uniref:hypothetical protein n=1 Tax=Methanoculleus sp. TaxID=90427 RepID=UPI00344B08F7
MIVHQYLRVNPLRVWNAIEQYFTLFLEASPECSRKPSMSELSLMQFFQGETACTPQGVTYVKPEE